MPARPEAATQFHALHKGPDLVILANAWDALSAKVIARAGAKAIATSSAAVAWAHGYADGHHLPFEKLRTTVEEIARVVALPISVDMEGGYADEPDEVGANVAAIIEAGGVGMNIEDGRGAPDLLRRKIEAAREAAARAGVDFFINARTDVYLKRLKTGDEAETEVIARGDLYKGVGADGLFVPGLADPAILARVASAVDLPLNVMGWKGVPGKSVLLAAGVRRLSAATNMARVAMHATARAAALFLSEGDSEAVAAMTDPDADYNSLFSQG